MNIVPAHIQNSSLLPEATLHIPVSGSIGCDQKLWMTLQAQYLDFSLYNDYDSEQIEFYYKLVNLINIAAI